MNSNRQLSILALSIFGGIAFPQLAAMCKPLLMPTIFLLFTFAIFQVRFSDAAFSALRDRSVWVILLWQLFFLPLCVAVILHGWSDSHWYLLAVVSMCTSSITATTALAKIFNLNDSLALVVCLGGTVLMPVPLYIFLSALTDAAVVIDLSVYTWRIIVFIVAPFLLVAIARRVLPVRVESTIRAKTPTVVLLLLMLFGLSVMDGVQELLVSKPLLLAGLVVLAFGLNLSVQLATFLCLNFIGVRNTRTACLLCAYRNMGIVAAIAESAPGEYFLIFVGVWQLPMYILPLLLKRWYHWQPEPVQ